MPSREIPGGFYETPAVPAVFFRVSNLLPNFRQWHLGNLCPLQEKPLFYNGLVATLNLLVARNKMATFITYC
jgi:hypothetical protein